MEIHPWFGAYVYPADLILLRAVFASDTLSFILVLTSVRRLLSRSSGISGTISYAVIYREDHSKMKAGRKHLPYQKQRERRGSHEKTGFGRR